MGQECHFRRKEIIDDISMFSMSQNIIKNIVLFYIYCLVFVSQKYFYDGNGLDMVMW